jgi:hypothetical protein
MHSNLLIGTQQILIVEFFRRSELFGKFKIVQLSESVQDLISSHSSPKSKYWRNNLVELGPSLSGFASFPRLVCQTNVLNPLLRKGKISSNTRESNPEPLG